MNEYAAIQADAGRIDQLVNTAFAFDLIEMQLTIAASAALLFPMPGMAAALAAGPRIHAAKAECDAATATIHRVTDGWLAKSRESLRLLAEDERRWSEMAKEAESIGEQIRATQGLSRESFWSGEAAEQKNAFGEELRRRHVQLTEAMAKMPGTLSGAEQLTRMIFMLVGSTLKQTVMGGGTMAMRAPFPRPAGLGLCTRTPMLAGLLRGKAAYLEAVASGFPWKPQEFALTASMVGVSRQINASRGKGRSGD